METDTIVALATPPGVSAIAVVRLSGPGSRAILARLCPELDPESPPVRRPALARILDPSTGETLDRGLVTLFLSPESYTGEDLVELSVHGGWLTPRLLEQACVELGARKAEPGEFTQRAYLAGKLDLVQAEAVADLIEGRSRALHRAAMGQLERGLSRRIGELRDGVLGLEALLAQHLDFPDEDEPPVPLARIVEAAGRVRAEMEALLRTAPEGELLREGARTVLAGRPNAGKSSLFNALIGEERAIVTEVPGTTRDALEAVVSLGGFPFRLVDTAGLRDTSERVERVGIEVAQRHLAEADLILFLAEAGRALDPSEREFLEQPRESPVVLVRTKADLTRGTVPRGGAEVRAPPGDRAPAGGPTPAGPVTLSVIEGRGIGELKALLPKLVFAGLVRSSPETPVLTRERQSRRLARAAEEVGAFAEALARGVPPEAASSHLRSAETALEELLGVITPDDVLDHVFRQFCIGK